MSIIRRFRLRRALWMGSIPSLLAVLLIANRLPLRAEQRTAAIPTNTRRPTVTATLTPVSTFIGTIPPGPFGGGEFATWTPPPPVFQFSEHFLMGRPIGADAVNYLARNYAYGSTDGGGRPIHHGDDFQNPAGTPILAVAEGIVEYAGDDVHKLFGPQPNFYGNVIVIRHKFVDYDGQPVFSLYGHLSRIAVATGQAIRQGDVIGLVGSAGVAVGAHLHLEVRVGDPTNYNGTRNPELWLAPFTTYGAVAGRVLDLNGQKLYSVRVELQASIYRETTTYADDSVNGDTRLGENFAVSDLPSGYYTITIKAEQGGLRYRSTIYVRPGKVSWVDINVSGP